MHFIDVIDKPQLDRLVLSVSMRLTVSGETVRRSSQELPPVSGRLAGKDASATSSQRGTPAE
jgi:hypothetical protein